MIIAESVAFSPWVCELLDWRDSLGEELFLPFTRVGVGPIAVGPLS